MSLKPNRIVAGLLLPLAILAAPSMASAAPTPEGQTRGAVERVIVVANSDADYDALRTTVQKAGGSIVDDIRDGQMLVATGAPGLKARVQATGQAKAVATDHIEPLIQPGSAQDLRNGSKFRARTQLGPAASAAAAGAFGRRPSGDPALTYPGLMWNLLRIDAPEAWQTTLGSEAVHIGVADTGVDFTHSDLAPQIASVVDFTGTEDPPICSTYFANPISKDLSAPGIGDADLAKMFGGPATTDWNGHGSWIGGNIAAALNGQGINGIAPHIKVDALKIAQWCGSAYDSTIMDSFLYAGKHRLDIVSISFGGYLDLTNPDQATIWSQYNQVVQKVRDEGTVIVAAAGNEHVRLGPDGRVTSHGPLTPPGTPVADFADLFGQYAAPGGVPGVVLVSSTGNVVEPSTPGCATGADPNTVCKPNNDTHQQTGAGRQNQLSYFSNYGPRIDVAAPGGAREFNLPVWDNGGSPGFPYTFADLTTDFAVFSTTSNWGIDPGIPCFTFTGGGFPANQCYTSLQGTSMSTPHASGVLALIASADRDARHNPAELIRILKRSALDVEGNTTQVLSATDMSPDDETRTNACFTGYCHLGGPAISDQEAYGAGLVDASRAVNEASR